MRARARFRILRLRPLQYPAFYRFLGGKSYWNGNGSWFYMSRLNDGQLRNRKRRYTDCTVGRYFRLCGSAGRLIFNRIHQRGHGHDSAPVDLGQLLRLGWLCGGRWSRTFGDDFIRPLLDLRRRGLRQIG
ncbi:MAG TPA: hypothetical protein VL101_06680 [Nordella sp.]|nr:hypothetical protein [Nordella sp.]